MNTVQTTSLTVLQILYSRSRVEQDEARLRLTCDIKSELITGRKADCKPRSDRTWLLDVGFHGRFRARSLPSW